MGAVVFALDEGGGVAPPCDKALAAPIVPNTSTTRAPIDVVRKRCLNISVGTAGRGCRREIVINGFHKTIGRPGARLRSVPVSEAQRRVGLLDLLETLALRDQIQNPVTDN